jgi:hypothetical protein
MVHDSKRVATQATCSLLQSTWFVEYVLRFVGDHDMDAFARASQAVRARVLEERVSRNTTAQRSVSTSVASKDGLEPFRLGLGCRSGYDHEYTLVCILKLADAAFHEQLKEAMYESDREHHQDYEAAFRRRTDHMDEQSRTVLVEQLGFAELEKDAAAEIIASHGRGSSHGGDALSLHLCAKTENLKVTCHCSSPDSAGTVVLAIECPKPLTRPVFLRVALRRSSPSHGSTHTGPGPCDPRWDDRDVSTRLEMQCQVVAEQTTTYSAPAHTYRYRESPQWQPEGPGPLRALAYDVEQSAVFDGQCNFSPQAQLFLVRMEVLRSRHFYLQADGGAAGGSSLQDDEVKEARHGRHIGEAEGAFLARTGGVDRRALFLGDPYGPNFWPASQLARRY